MKNICKNLLKISLFISLLLLSNGCSSVKPYAEIGVAYPLDYYTDWHLQTDRTWQCSNGPKAILELGVEKDHLRIGIHHESWWLCGNSRKSRRELYFNDIRIVRKWGGS